MNATVTILEIWKNKTEQFIANSKKSITAKLVLPDCENVDYERGKLAAIMELENLINYNVELYLEQGRYNK